MHVGDLAVGGHAGLQRDVRTPLAHRGHERPVQRHRLVGEKSSLDRNAGGAQGRGAPACDERVRIRNGRHHTAHTGGLDERRARWGASVMIARLERDVERRAARAGPGRLEGFDLRMRPTGARVKALADDLAVAHHHRADHRIG